MEFSFLSSLLKMFFALAVVLGLMLGAAYILKRVMNQPTARVDSASPINILATRYIGPKNSIMLIEVLGQILVVGISGTQMSFLTEISDSEALLRMREIPDRFEMTCSPSVDPIQRYKAILQSLYADVKDKLKK